MKLGHVAVFTADMESSIKFYQLLGGKTALSSVLDMEDGRSKKLMQMVFDGGTVELVEPSHDDMMYNGAGICEHFCFDVDDVDKVFYELKDKGIDTFDAEKPYELDILGGIKVIFLTGPSREIIELYQKL